MVFRRRSTRMARVTLVEAGRVVVELAAAAGATGVAVAALRLTGQPVTWSVIGAVLAGIVVYDRIMVVVRMVIRYLHGTADGHRAHAGRPAGPAVDRIAGTDHPDRDGRPRPLGRQDSAPGRDSVPDHPGDPEGPGQDASTELRTRVARVR